MQTFKVYPKGKGEPFDLVCERFEIKNGRFILYDSSDKESQDGFLSFHQIAAIIPDQSKMGYAGKPISFLVYLKGRSQPVEVFGHAFKIEDEMHKSRSGSQVVFLTQRKDIMHNIEQEWTLDGIYIALSEVIAIVPSDGLQSRY